jgi:hypothetical protein
MPPPAFNSRKPINGGAIAGGVIGGLVFLALLGGIFAWYKRKKSVPIEQQTVPTPYEPPQEPPQLTSSHSFRVPANASVGAYPRSEKVDVQSEPTSVSSEVTGLFSRPSATGSHITSPMYSVIGFSESDSTAQLRTEVDGLRREMEQLRYNTSPEEPPPMYAFGSVF